VTKGWHVAADAEYVDHGVSGVKVRRPELDRLMADVAAGKCDVVAVWKFDRFARSMQHLVTALNEFRERGVEFASVQDGIDTSTPAGRMVFGVIASLAEFERELIVERVKAAMALKKKRGEVAGTAPFGFVASGEKRGRGPDGKRSRIAGPLRLLVPLAHEQRALERMRELRALGASCRAIAEALQGEGHKPRGKRWHVKTVQRALAVAV
jgi:DNA invertase Pin-like site-specific DNA recombinase